MVSFFVTGLNAGIGWRIQFAVTDMMGRRYGSYDRSDGKTILSEMSGTDDLIVSRRSGIGT